MTSSWREQLQKIGPKTEAEREFFEREFPKAILPEPMPPLVRVARADIKRVSASVEFRDAIKAAHASGYSLRAIAAAARISHVRVLKILRDE